MSSRPIARLVLSAFVVAVAVAGPAAAEEPWKTFAVKGGVTFEKRAVPDSKYFEYRASTAVTAAPRAVVDAIWSGITGAIPATVKKRVVLERSENELLVYDQIHAPVVSDRDVTIRLRKTLNAAGDAAEVRFESMNALGPPLAPSFVRLPVVRGAWQITAAPGGGSQLSYTCYSEPGGSVPAFLVRGTQQDQIGLDVDRILSRLHVK